MTNQVNVTADNADEVFAKLSAHYAELRKSQIDAIQALYEMPEFTKIEGELLRIVGVLGKEPMLGPLVARIPGAFAQLKAAVALQAKAR